MLLLLLFVGVLLLVEEEKEEGGGACAARTSGGMSGSASMSMVRSVAGPVCICEYVRVCINVDGVHRKERGEEDGGGDTGTLDCLPYL